MRIQSLLRMLKIRHFVLIFRITPPPTPTTPKRADPFQLCQSCIWDLSSSAFPIGRKLLEDNLSHLCSFSAICPSSNPYDIEFILSKNSEISSKFAFRVNIFPKSKTLSREGVPSLDSLPKKNFFLVTR